MRFIILIHCVKTRSRHDEVNILVRNDAKNNGRNAFAADVIINSSPVQNIDAVAVAARKNTAVFFLCGAEYVRIVQSVVGGKSVRHFVIVYIGYARRACGEYSSVRKLHREAELRAVSTCGIFVEKLCGLFLLIVFYKSALTVGGYPDIPL